MNTNTAEILELDNPNNPILDQVLKLTKLDIEPDYKVHYEEMIKTYFGQLAQGHIVLDNDIRLSQAIGVRIAELDVLLEAQINEILHHPEFQELEGSWRSLHRFTKSIDKNSHVIVNLLDVTKEEILLDAQCAADFDDSGLFRIIYEDGYGTFGGNPYGLIVSQFEFTKSADDIECLKAISRVASAAHAPFIASASPELFGLNSFEDLEKMRSLENLFSSPEFRHWNTFRETEEAKYVVLTLSKYITRLPYGKNRIAVKEFSFQEELGNKEDEMFVWGSSAFLLAEKIVRSFQDYGWFQNIHGIENGGLIKDLPLYEYRDENGLKQVKVPTQIVMNDRRERELANFVFMPLGFKKNASLAVFFSSKNLHEPPIYENDLANANAHLTTDLSYLLVMCRFAHYLKVMVQEKIGSFSTLKEIDTYLNKWISKYVIANDDVDNKVKSQHPLREAKVYVCEVPGMIGCYNTAIFLKPHYYLNELTISLRLVSSLNF